MPKWKEVERLTRQPLHKLLPPQDPVPGKHFLEETRSVVLNLVDENGVDPVEPLFKDLGRCRLQFTRGYGCISIADPGIVPVINLLVVVVIRPFDLNDRRVSAAGD